jgi:hypothetical protein
MENFAIAIAFVFIYPFLTWFCVHSIAKNLAYLSDERLATVFGGESGQGKGILLGAALAVGLTEALIAGLLVFFVFFFHGMRVSNPPGAQTGVASDSGRSVNGPDTVSGLENTPLEQIELGQIGHSGN